MYAVFFIVQVLNTPPSMAQDTPHSAAAALLDFLVEAPLLTASDKKGVLKLIKGLDPSGFDLIARSGHGISVFRTASCSSNHIYSVTGMGEVAAPPRVSTQSLLGQRCLHSRCVTAICDERLHHRVQQLLRCHLSWSALCMLPAVFRVLQ
jgi:hypothetical protein